MGNKIILQSDEYISVQNRYQELLASEKKGDFETFKASFIMLLAVLDPYWESFNFTFGKDNLKPLYDLVKLTAQEFERLPKQKEGLTTEEYLKELSSNVTVLLANNGLKPEETKMTVVEILVAHEEGRLPDISSYVEVISAFSAANKSYKQVKTDYCQASGIDSKDSVALSKRPTTNEALWDDMLRKLNIVTSLAEEKHVVEVV